MQIRVTKDATVVKFTKTEERKLDDVHAFLAGIPKGLEFEKEREAAEKALKAFIEAT